MDTVGVMLVICVIVNVFDVAVTGVAQVAFEVMIHVTASLLSGAYEYVTLFEPTELPFTFH